MASNGKGHPLSSSTLGVVRREKCGGSDGRKRLSVKTLAWAWQLGLRGLENFKPARGMHAENSALFVCTPRPSSKGTDYARRYQ